MAVDFTEGFEAGPNGTAITSSNSNFNGSSAGSGTVTFDSSVLAHGSFSAKFVNSSNTINLQRTFTSANQRTMRRYFRVSALPASTVFLTLQSLRLATVRVADIRCSTGGNLSMRDGNSTVATASTGIAINTWNRYEWQVDGVGTTQTLKLFYGSNNDGDTPDETITGSYTGGNFDNTTQGIIVNTTNLSMWLDDALDRDDLTYPGSAAPATGSIFVFTHAVTIG